MTSSRKQIGGYLGTISGEKEANRPEQYLIEETYLSFGVASPDLVVSATAPKASALSLIPVGVPLSVSALLPTLGVTRHRSNSGDVDFDGIPRLEWKIQTVDFVRNTADPFASLASSNDFVLPSTTSADLGGAYQILSGDLASQDLTIVPWPDQGNELDENIASDKLRGFKISLDITVLVRNLGQSTFTYNKSLYGIVNSWSSIFTSSSLTIPMTPKDVTASKPDLLGCLRDLLELRLDNKYPEVGEVATVIVQPQSRRKIARGNASPLSISSSSGSANGNIRIGGTGGIASVDMGGITFHENGPTTIGNLPSQLGTNQVSSMTSTFGGSILGPAQDVVQIGALTVLADTDINDLTINTSGATAYVRKFPAQLGAIILPLPLFVPEGPDTVRTAINVSITATIKFRVPGRKSNLQAIVKFPDTLLYPPIIKVPQVALFFRDPVSTTEEPRNAQNEILVSMDPSARIDRPDIQYLRSTIDYIVERLQQFLDVYPKKEYIGTIKNTDMNALVNLLNVCKTVTDCLDRPRARLLNASPDTATQIGQSETVNVGERFKDFVRTINSFIWMGPPSPRSRYQLKLTSDPAVTPADPGMLYVPYVSTPGVVWDKSRPETTRPHEIGFAALSGTTEGAVEYLDKGKAHTIAVKEITWQYR